MKIEPIAVAVEDYKRMIEKPYYYVDKTLLIKDILDKGGYVNLFTRPRRFGKTLALSMVQTFFELELDKDRIRVDNSKYFLGKKIMSAGEEYTDKMGKFPVISLSLKSAKQPEYEMAYQRIIDQISKEYERHNYVLEGTTLLEVNQNRYIRIMERQASVAEYAASLEFLSICLKKYHNSNVIILLDEYDVPLENAYFRGYYNKMMDFICALFESALKTNLALEFAFITGCLRISRDSIFTGLNNLKVVSILDNSYAEYFGFTQAEVNHMLDKYGLMEKQKEIKEWYNGYLFGNTEVYNPWSVCCYIDDRIGDHSIYPKAYWSNTSSNDIVKEMVKESNSLEKQELEELIAGGTIEKPIHEGITYEDIQGSRDNIWNFLFFTGYLKAGRQRLEQETLYLEMKIPNKEVGYIYRNTIREWFSQKIKTTDISVLYQSIIAGNNKTLEEFIKKLLRESISFYDSAETFYHGFLLGLFSMLAGYEVLSNRESGEGRPDIMLKPYDEREPAIILELKKVEKFTQMEQGCDRALYQIEEKNYKEELLEEGYQKILKYGICFCKKSCMVKVEE